MLPSLRRKNQKLSDEEVQAVIARERQHAMRVAGDDGPYPVHVERRGLQESVVVGRVAPSARCPAGHHNLDDIRDR